jgi:hypothetical protein
MLGFVARTERPRNAIAILRPLVPSISAATVTTSQIVARKARVASGASMAVLSMFLRKQPASHFVPASYSILLNYRDVRLLFFDCQPPWGHLECEAYLG